MRYVVKESKLCEGTFYRDGRACVIGQCAEIKETTVSITKAVTAIIPVWDDRVHIYALSDQYVRTQNPNLKEEMIQIFKRHDHELIFEA